MFAEAGASHHRPHFHAYCQDHAAAFAIDTIECLGGGLPVGSRGRCSVRCKDLQTFNAVTLDTEAGTLVWPTGADFDPATLHDWPSVSEELAVRAARWASQSDRRAG
jgi:hypothetical protein